MPKLLDANIKIRPLGVGETGPIGLYVGGGKACPAGAPNVQLDIGEAFAYYKAEPITYVGVMNLFVQSLSPECFTYFTWEMKLWDGLPGASCPTTSPELQEVSRFLGDLSPTKIISITRLNAAENKMIGCSFEVPASMEGEKVLCLSLWGNFNRQALLDELLNDGGYAEEVPW